MIAHDGSHVWPDHGAPTLREIGIGLGRLARFAGQTRDYYTVLSHSLAVASCTPLQYRVYALLHDAHEAVLGDTVTTWKTDQRRELEDTLQARIHASLGLPEPGPEALAEVKRADLACLAAEAHILGHPEAEKWWPIADVDIEAHIATTRQLVVCHAWLNAHRAGERLITAYRRITRDDPTSSMAETLLEAAASVRGAH